VLEFVLSDCARAGADVELLDLAKLDLPFYEWGTAPTADARRLVDTMRSADALVWASPLYHGSVSGSFKNAVDWLELLAAEDPPYLTDKPVGLVSVAGGGHALHAITAMQQMVHALRGWAIPLVVPLHRARAVVGNDGAIADDRVRTQLEALAREIVRAGRRFRADH
jgi:FMN reductase